MTDLVRRLANPGIAAFAAYLGHLREGVGTSLPTHLLMDPTTSESMPLPMEITRQPHGRPFESRYEFGKYLKEVLQGQDRRQISRDFGMWTWLALYFLDQLCPAEADGTRKPIADEAYILASTFKYDSYYRHLVRTPWLAVCEHGEHSKVLLIPAGRPTGNPLAQRGELIEQLAARQNLFGTPSIIEAAARMYFDASRGRPKRGAGGAGAGSPRRLALVVQQFELTYDLRACTADQFLGLLPREFARWQGAEVGN